MDRTDGPDVMEPRTAVNRAAVAMSVVLLPAWSLSFAESTLGFPLFIITTVSIVAVAFTVQRPIVNPLADRTAAVLLYVVVPIAGVISLAFNPSTAGAILVFSMVAVVGLLLAVADFSKRELRSYVAAPFLAMASFQAVIVVIQSLTDSAFGYALLHPGADLLVTEGYARPQGMYDHVYEAAIVGVLAVGIGLALLPKSGRMRHWLLAGIGLASVTVALTHSRSAFVALVLIAIVTAVGSVRRLPTLRAGLAVTLIAFAVPALMTASIWEARLTESVNGSVDDASSGRITLMKQAVDLAADHPLVGVGPNRYMDVLEATVDPSEIEFVVHNIPLMVTAELGIPAGFAFSVLLVWTGFQSVVAGYRTSILFAAAIPFMMFDVIMYNRPLGLLLFAIWAGILGAMTKGSRVTQSEERADAHHS